MKNLLKLFLFSMCIFVKSPIQLPDRNKMIAETYCRIEDAVLAISIKINTAKLKREVAKLQGDNQVVNLSDEQIKEVRIGAKVEIFEEFKAALKRLESLSDDALAREYAQHKLGLYLLKKEIDRSAPLLMIDHVGENRVHHYMTFTEFSNIVNTPEQIELFEIAFGKGSYNLDQLVFRTVCHGGWESGSRNIVSW